MQDGRTTAEIAFRTSCHLVTLLWCMRMMAPQREKAMTKATIRNISVTTHTTPKSIDSAQQRQEGHNHTVINI